MSRCNVSMKKALLVGALVLPLAALGTYVTFQQAQQIVVDSLTGVVGGDLEPTRARRRFWRIHRSLVYSSQCKAVSRLMPCNLAVILQW